MLQVRAEQSLAALKQEEGAQTTPEPSHTSFLSVSFGGMGAGEKHVPKSSNSKRVTSLQLFPLRIM